MYEMELQAAIRAVRQASIVTEAVRKSLANISVSKEDKSPVTVADFAAQALINMALAESFPYPIVGEEDSELLKAGTPESKSLLSKIVDYVGQVRSGTTEAQVLEAIDRGHHAGGKEGRFWALDPVDGTKGFLRNDQYAVCLALIDQGNVVLGVLGCPNLAVNYPGDGERGMLYYASQGKGAFESPLSQPDAVKPIHVHDIEVASEGVVLESVEAAHTSHGAAQTIMSELSVTGSVRMDSQVKYGILASGTAKGSIYLRLPKEGVKYIENIWDHAAGKVIVEEAGGKVTDIRGAPLDFSQGRKLFANTGVIATSGKIHAQVIAAVGKAIPQ